MTESKAFLWVCEALEHRTSIARLIARGTVRIALRRGGLDVERVTREEMILVLERLMPKELATRGVEDAAAVVEDLVRELRAVALDEQPAGKEKPEDVARRMLGGRT